MGATDTRPAQTPLTNGAVTIRLDGYEPYQSGQIISAADREMYNLPPNSDVTNIRKLIRGLQQASSIK